MKKIASFVLILILLSSTMILSSCGANSDPLISIKMTKFNPWIEDNAGDIVKIEEIHTYRGIAPDNEMQSYYTEDPEVIEKYMQWLAKTTLVPAIFEPTGGGSSVKMVFTLADGSEKEIQLSNGYYFNIFLFDTQNKSNFDRKTMNSFYRYNVQDNTGYSIYTYGENATLVKKSETGAENLSFVRLNDAEEPGNEPTHYLEASFGIVYIYSDTLCSIEPTRPDAYLGGYYVLYGTTFSELMK